MFFILCWNETKEIGLSVTSGTSEAPTHQTRVGCTFTLTNTLLDHPWTHPSQSMKARFVCAMC